MFIGRIRVVVKDLLFVELGKKTWNVYFGILYKMVSMFSDPFIHGVAEVPLTSFPQLQVQ